MERRSIASELDNQQVFSPPNGSVHGASGVLDSSLDYGKEGSVKYGVTGPAGNLNTNTLGGKHGGIYGKTGGGGSINGGFVSSDNEMMYGLAPPGPRGAGRFSGREGPRRDGSSGRPPSSLRL